MIKCVRVLCVKFGHACVHGIWLCACVCSISQPFSWPPYAELGAQAGSICRVNAQPQPRAAVPYKPHYSSRNHGKKSQPPHAHPADAQRHSQWETDTIDGAKDYHTMTKSPEPAWEGVSETHFGCLSRCQMNTADKNSLFSTVKPATGQATH